MSGHLIVVNETQGVLPNSSIYLFIYLFFIYSFIHSFHPFVHSFIHSFIHSFQNPYTLYITYNLSFLVCSKVSRRCNSSSRGKNTCDITVSFCRIAIIVYHVGDKNSVLGRNRSKDLCRLEIGEHELDSSGSAQLRDK